MADEPRFREDEKETVGSVSLQYATSWGPTSLSPYSNHGCKTGYAYKSMHDVKHPGFKKRVMDGEIINSPCEAYNESSTWSLSNFYLHRSWTAGGTTPWYLYTGTISADVLQVSQPAHLTMSDDDIQSYVDKAVFDCASKVAESYVDMGQFVAEFKQTCRLFDETAAMAISLTRKLMAIDKSLFRRGYHWNYENGSRMIKDLAKRNLNKRALSRNSKALGNLWLQYRYGLRPLLSEMQGAIDALTRVLSSRYSVHGVKLHYDSDSSSDVGNISTSLCPTGSVQSDVDRQLKLIAKAGCMYSFESRAFDHLTAFGWNDLFKLGWELIPYSFVVDWIINVGDWLSHISPQSGYNVLSHWTTVILESRVSQTLTPRNIDEFGNDVGTCTGTVYFDSSVRRYYRVPKRWGVVQKPPIIDVSLTVSKLIDGIALLRQLQ